MPNFTIGPSRAAYPHETLGALAFDAWGKSAFGIDDAGRADRTRLAQEFVDFCRDFPHTMVLARSGELFLGWGAREKLDHVISDLWVSPAAQRLGVGTRLLRALERPIIEAGHPYAELETYAANAGAVRFYERHGYRQVWRGMKPSAILGYDLDKIRLRKPLGA